MPTEQWELGKFFEIVDDPDLFRFRNHNFFKLFHTLFLDRQAQELYPAWRPKTRGPRSVKWALSKLWALARSLGKAISLGLRSRDVSRVLFFGGTDRYSVIGGKVYDLYNARIVEHEGRARFVIVQSTRDRDSKQYEPDLLVEDFVALVGLLKGISRLVLAGGARRYARTIVTAYPELGFSENEIASIIVDFYARFGLYRFLLALLAPQRTFLIAYYGLGKAPLIAACKAGGIEVVELMHSSIFGTHPHYNFPESYGYLYSQGFFPDKVAVYGQYWKEVLVQGNMFSEESIVVTGYYYKVPEKEDVPRPPAMQGKTVILVSTQPKLSREFGDYVSFLRSKLDPDRWHIVVKPHPKERDEAHARLVEPGFVSVSRTSVYELLALADIHISAYSSVIYEALRYQVCNYVLMIDSASALCEAIVESGVALPLRPDQVPEPCAPPDSQIRYYFEEYNHAVLFGQYLRGDVTPERLNELHRHEAGGTAV
jgi:hypothetical protein